MRVERGDFASVHISAAVKSPLLRRTFHKKKGNVNMHRPCHSHRLSALLPRPLHLAVPLPYVHPLRVIPPARLGAPTGEPVVFIPAVRLVDWCHLIFRCWPEDRFLQRASRHFSHARLEAASHRRRRVVLVGGGSAGDVGAGAGDRSMDGGGEGRQGGDEVHRDGRGARSFGDCLRPVPDGAWPLLCRPSRWSSGTWCRCVTAGIRTGSSPLTQHKLALDHWVSRHPRGRGSRPEQCGDIG